MQPRFEAQQVEAEERPASDRPAESGQQLEDLDGKQRRTWRGRQRTETATLRGEGGRRLRPELVGIVVAHPAQLVATPAPRLEWNYGRSDLEPRSEIAEARPRDSLVEAETVETPVPVHVEAVVAENCHVCRRLRILERSRVAAINTSDAGNLQLADESLRRSTLTDDSDT